MRIKIVFFSSVPVISKCVNICVQAIVVVLTIAYCVMSDVCKIIVVLALRCELCVLLRINTDCKTPLALTSDRASMRELLLHNIDLAKSFAGTSTWHLSFLQFSAWTIIISSSRADEIGQAVLFYRDQWDRKWPIISSYHLDFLWRPIRSSEGPYKVKYRLNSTTNR